MAEKATKHRDGCARAFARRDPECARCRELAAGAAPREGWGERRKRQEARLLAHIRAHDCAKAKCGPICTFGDW